MKLGQPKASVRLQLASNFKAFDSSNGDGEELKFNDFMTKLSLKYADTPSDAVNLIQSSIFKDGTPVIVVNLRRLKFRPDDINYLVYKLLETASQVWENKFYLIYDFSEFYFSKWNLLTNTLIWFHHIHQSNSSQAVPVSTTSMSHEQSIPV